MSKPTVPTHFYATCQECNREFSTCEIRTCPQTQQKICRYCCMKCDNNVTVGTWQECKLIDGGIKDGN